MTAEIPTRLRLEAAFKQGALGPRMSQMGQKRKWSCLNGMSVLPPIVLQKSFCRRCQKF